MGADFLERTKKNFKRSWDLERVALATADLLTRQPDCAGRSVVGEIIGGAKLAPGERLTVERDAGGLVVRRGLTDVVRISAAPADVVKAIEDSCGVGVGTIDQVHDVGGVVEIFDMLKQQSTTKDTRPVAKIAEHRLWQDETRNTPSLGCWHCPERRICGGMLIEAGLMSCLDFCCGQPAKCDKACRNNPDFALRVREVNTFALENVPRAPLLVVPPLPLVVSVLFHGSSREELLASAPVALPLYKMFNRRDGSLRFSSHAALGAEFGLAPGTPVVLTGTDKDPPLERWWSFGSRRREIIRGLKTMGVALTTTPNFSLFVDVPRHVDLHAIKRIALVHGEFLEEGLPAALHVNGRSETDFRRWGAYVRARAEVTHLAYEFTTGTGRAARRDLHAEWLTGVAIAAGRPLDLIVRGGIDVLPQLTAVFNRVSVLETWSFMKTMKRQRAIPRAGNPGWQRAPSAVGAPLDALFAVNRAEVRRWIEREAAAQPVRPKAAAAAG